MLKAHAEGGQGTGKVKKAKTMRERGADGAKKMVRGVKAVGTAVKRLVTKGRNTVTRGK